MIFVAGYFKIYREIFESSIWLQPVELRLFLYLIGQARYKEKPNKKYESQGIIIKRGQFLRSYRKIRDDLEYLENKSVKNYSLSAIKRAIDKLIEEERIETEKTPLGTLFTVCNYCQYQDYQEKKEERGTESERSRNGAGTELEQYSKKGVIKGKKGKEECSDSKSPNEPVESEPKFTEEDRAYKAALYLRKRILENNSKAQVPEPNPEDMEKWAQEMDRLNRLGPVGKKDAGYTWKEIAMIMDFSQEDKFWSGNILSAPTLREKIIQLENKMKRNIKKGSWQAGQKSEKRKEIYLKYKQQEENEDNSGGGVL